MESIKYQTCVLFGGNGFIGSHFAAHLLQNNLANEVILADVVKATPDMWPKFLQLKFAAGEVKYVQIDVRKPIDSQPDSNQLPSNPDLIVNLSAVHKEPGHQAHEYFETNLPGAENVCAWAEKVNCKTIVFTSSIATYGSGQETKDEDSLPMPTTPYGISKLVAEKIHLAWQNKETQRKLLIVRPGVIFGAGERGNVTRMLRAILGHYFFYSGNQETRKAGGYVKELCNSMAFMLKWQNEHNQPATIFNFTMDPAPSVQEYAEAMTKVAEVKRTIFNVPFKLLLGTSYFMAMINSAMGRKPSISPVTVRKVLRSNNIIPKVLKELGYQYQYNLEQGLADWQKERPIDW